MNADDPWAAKPEPAQDATSGPVVYLIHFAQRYKHAGHYLECTDDLASRLEAHRKGYGCRLMEVVASAGIGWTLARTWPGAGRARERQLKKMGGASRRCPECGVKPQAGHRPRRQPKSAIDRQLLRGQERRSCEISTPPTPEASRETEGRTVARPERIITSDMTSAEVASLLATLQDGHEAARQTTRMSWPSPERQSRSDVASEINATFLDVMSEAVENGMRQPGETVEQFSRRAAAEAQPGATGSIPACDAGQHDIPGSRAAKEEQARQLLNDPATPEGRAYAEALSDMAASRVRELREREPLPEPDRTPGAPHLDPFLAARGWHVGSHGLYTRQQDPQPEADTQAEAG
jgi:predicted GIY-YIG superfamily endonuclease